MGPGPYIYMGPGPYIWARARICGPGPIFGAPWARKYHVDEASGGNFSQSFSHVFLISWGTADHFFPISSRPFFFHFPQKMVKNGFSEMVKKWKNNFFLQKSLKLILNVLFLPSLIFTVPQLFVLSLFVVWS